MWMSAALWDLPTNTAPSTFSPVGKKSKYEGIRLLVMPHVNFIHEHVMLPQVDTFWDKAIAGFSPTVLWGPSQSCHLVLPSFWKTSTKKTPARSDLIQGFQRYVTHGNKYLFKIVLGGQRWRTIGGLWLESQSVKISYSVTPKDQMSDEKENLFSFRHSMAYLYREQIQWSGSRQRTKHWAHWKNAYCE